ncbi:MAG: hypothetical protein Q4B91_06410 [Atopobiaceae bacterium]|nr:hypothetical protein [Atopobiaceae bacterium]
MSERVLGAAARTARRTGSPRSSPRGGDLPRGRNNPAVGHAGRARRPWRAAVA